MKKFFFKIILFVITTACICYIFQYVIDSGLKKYNNDEYGEWNKIFEGKINADVIILGSSRATTQYDPKVIKNVTGLSCYNLGVSGAKILIQTAKYQSFLVHDKHPIIIIQNVEIMYLRKDDYIYNKQQFLPYLSQSTVYPYLERIDKNVWLEKSIPLYKYRGLEGTVSLGVKSYLGLLKKPVRLKYKGYKPLNEGWNLDFERFKAKNKERVYTKKDLQVGFTILKKLIVQCRRDNIKLIFVHAPMYFELQQMIPQKDSVNTEIALLAKRNNLPFWDYSKDTLSYSKKYFYNSMHLNKRGAEIFSKDLADRVNKYFENDTLLFYSHNKTF